MIQTFGDFVEESRNGGSEYLVIGFSPASIPLKQRWRNNGLSADFIADYLQTFFVGNTKQDSRCENAPIPVKSRNAVKYIANELLENAMKFNDEMHTYQTRISFHLGDDHLVFYVSNSVDLEGSGKFQLYIDHLLNNDPHELYIQQMEANALAESVDGGNSHSGLGFLSMICDYSATLAWRFEPAKEQPPAMVVTTMVSLAI